MKAKQVFQNAKWIIMCKIVQSLLQLVIGMLCARYLGPSNYGLINYAASITNFVMPLMKLGFDSTLVYELVEHPDKEGEVLGTSVLLNLFSSVACVMGVTAFSAVANMGEIETIIVCALYSTSLVFAALEMIQYWFQYKLLSKYSSIVMLISYVVVSAYRIFLLATGKNVYWFAMTHSLDFFIISLFLFVLYKKKGAARLSFSFQTAKRMLSNSKHYMFSSLMVVVVQNTDHIMITLMVGETENGYYSAAITCIVVAQFVYNAIVDSFRPLILTKKKENSDDYQLNVSRLYSIILYLVIAQCIVFVIFAKLIVSILFGLEEYSQAIPILRILAFYYIFSLMGVVRKVWILAEDQKRLLWITNLFGAAFNIVLNAFLIPHYGALGAAFASFLTQLFVNLILGFIIKPLRENNRLMMKGLNPIFFVKELKKIILMILKKDKA